MRISPETIEEIRSRVDLLALVGERVELKPAGGGNFKGLCPFHQEKTPSFNVTPAKGAYHCFGCSEGGDAFRFVRTLDGLSFPDAVRKVAAFAGVEVAAAGHGEQGGRGRRETRSRGHGLGAGAHEHGRRRQGPREGGEVRQIGDTARAKVVKTYDYTDIRGELLYQVCRTEPKSFRQRRPDGKGGWLWNMKGQDRVLYRIPDLAAAFEAGDPVYVCEGEKDADAVHEAMGVATCNTGGAGKWEPELAEPFARARGPVRIVQDRDDPGRKHARAVFDSIAAVVPEGVEVTILEPADGKDLSDHLADGRTLEGLLQVWPEPDDLAERDPRRFKRSALRRALEEPEGRFEVTDLSKPLPTPTQPKYPVGIIGSTRLRHLQGVATLAGGPSSGKSFLAMATGIDAARSGWEVFYVACEMPKRYVVNRAARAMASAGMTSEDAVQSDKRALAIESAKGIRLPATFYHVEAGLGLTAEGLIHFLAEVVTERPTLVILDSVSSFVANMRPADGDPFGMGPLTDVIRWLCAARNLTDGQVAWLVISEMNREGRTKGRSLDHRSDIAITLSKSPEKQGVKLGEVTKCWYGPDGELPEMVLDHELGRLRVLE